MDVVSMFLKAFYFVFPFDRSTATSTPCVHKVVINPHLYGGVHFSSKYGKMTWYVEFTGRTLLIHFPYFFLNCFS